MISNQKLFSIGNFDFRLQHLLVIGILALSVSISMTIRSTPASYGFELFEFDPYFNYRATEYIIENGMDDYFNWIDTKSWHPFNRNVSQTSQVTLHLTTAHLYQIFGSGSSLYEFTILFPLVIGSLTAVVVFAFVRVLAGTTAGLFAALIFSISVPIFSRGLIGWFKSEPLGLFFAFIAMYLFVSGLKFNKGKISFVKLIFAGLFLSLGLSAWGGILFFIIPIILFYFALPFFKTEKNFLIWATPTFTISFLIFSLAFERTSGFIVSYAGLAILLPTIYVIGTEIIKIFSNDTKKIRNCFIFLCSIVVSGVGITSAGLISLPSFRYLHAVNPFLVNNDALTDSVAEHSVTDISLSFSFLSIFMIFSLIGIWFVFSKKYSNLKNDMRIFILIISIIGIYVSSAFIRLELFASIGVIILGSIGLTILLQKILEQNNHKIPKIIFPVIIVIVFLIPVTMPTGSAWVDWADFSPTILTGGSTYSFTSDDWIQAMTWLKQNTSEDAVIASWWDYGYWITSLSERTTIVDNATLIDWQIQKMAYSLITPPENSWYILNSDYTADVSSYIGNENIVAWGGWTTTDFKNNYTTFKILENEDITYDKLSNDDKMRIDNYIQKNGHIDCVPIYKIEAIQSNTLEQSCNPITKGMDADYLLIYLIGERFYTESFSYPLFTLEGGGDESKKSWFANISNHQVSKYVESDNITPTPYFMENSTLGKLIPFSIVKYVEPNTGRTFDQYQDGLIPVYVNEMKFVDPENDPFILVYASPSFYDPNPGMMSTILIYKINPDFG
tara:strand:- start:320 stop:2677 length:2358 start_codon:yes stop_codon:yes gene_type:complete